EQLHAHKLKAEHLGLSLNHLFQARDVRHSCSTGRPGVAAAKAKWTGPSRRQPHLVATMSGCSADMRSRRELQAEAGGPQLTLFAPQREDIDDYRREGEKEPLHGVGEVVVGQIAGIGRGELREARLCG